MGKHCLHIIIAPRAIYFSGQIIFCEILWLRKMNHVHVPPNDFTLPHFVTAFFDFIVILVNETFKALSGIVLHEYLIDKLSEKMCHQPAFSDDKNKQNQ